MPPPTTREGVPIRLRKAIENGSIVVGAGAGEINGSIEMFLESSSYTVPGMVPQRKQLNSADASSSSSTTRADSEWPAEAH